MKPKTGERTGLRARRACFRLAAATGTSLLVVTAAGIATAPAAAADELGAEVATGVDAAANGNRAVAVQNLFYLNNRTGAAASFLLLPQVAAPASAQQLSGTQTAPASAPAHPDFVWLPVAHRSPTSAHEQQPDLVVGNVGISLAK